jgi:transposase-like protein
MPETALDFGIDAFCCLECKYKFGDLITTAAKTEVKIYLADGASVVIQKGEFHCPSCSSKRTFKSVSDYGCGLGGTFPIP